MRKLAKFDAMAEDSMLGRGHTQQYDRYVTSAVTVLQKRYIDIML